MLDVRYEVAGEDIVSEAFDGDIVVLDLQSGKYFSFTDLGCALWEALAAGAVPNALIAASTKAPADIETFLTRLLDHQLLAVSKDGADFTATAGMLGKIDAAKEQADLFVFDDLADLFLADPIHDVEEPEGWPVVKKD